MKAEEFREMQDSELDAQLEEKRQELFRLKFRAATMELENPKLMQENRRDIARILTIRRERELAKAEQND